MKYVLKYGVGGKAPGTGHNTMMDLFPLFSSANYNVPPRIFICI